MTQHYLEKVISRLDHLQNKLEYLREFQDMSLEEFNEDIRNEATVERYFQTAIEAAIDIAQLIVIEEQLERPSETRTHFSMLADADILAKDLAERLNSAKRFRNILVHEYVSIEQEYIHKALKYDLHDLEKFVSIMAKYQQSKTVE